MFRFSLATKTLTDIQKKIQKILDPKTVKTLKTFKTLLNLKIQNPYKVGWKWGPSQFFEAYCVQGCARKTLRTFKSKLSQNTAV